MRLVIDFWRWQNLLGLSLISVLIPFSTGKRVTLSGKLIWTYVLLSALWVFQNPYKFQEFGVEFDRTTGQAFSQVLLIPLGVLLIPKKLFPHWRKGALFVGMIEALMLLFYGKGLCGGDTFDSAFVAAMMPFAHWILVPIFLAAIFSVPGATAVVVMLAQIVSLLIRSRHWKYLLALPVLTIVALYFQGSNLWNSHGRLTFWQAHFDWWFKQDRWFKGTGIGTFETLAQRVGEFRFGDLRLLQMHNDWLQILFEGGIAGLAIAIIFYIDLLSNAWNRPKLVAAWLGVGAFMMTYHPLHFFLTATFIACLARETLEVEI